MKKYEDVKEEEMAWLEMERKYKIKPFSIGESTTAFNNRETIERVEKMRELSGYGNPFDR